MTISIPLSSAFDVETFDGLEAFIIAYLELDAETQAQVPTFIRLAEYELDRMLTVPQRESLSDLTTTAGIEFVDLPVDARQVRQAYYVADNGYPLEPVSLNVLRSQYSTKTSGAPLAYAISDQAAYFGPVPDGAYAIRLTYLTKLPALSEDNQTNWLLSNNADAYVYATLAQAAGWLEDFDAASAFRSMLDVIMPQVNAQGNRYRNASPMRLRSPGVVV